MTHPKVFTIILNWNGKEDTIECLASLQSLNYPNHEIIVVDNGSTDDSVSVLRAQYPDITIIENVRNLGFSEGNNVGLKYAYENDADYFLILNNDTVVDPDVLGALVRIAEKDDCIGFVTGKVYFYDKPNQFQAAGKHSHPIFLVGHQVGWGEIDHGQYDQIKEYEFVDGVFFLVRRQAYEETGGFDPNFFLYWDEADWCVRVRRAGYNIVYTPEAKIWHKFGRSVGGDSSFTWEYYMTRNRIVFLRRHCSRSAFARSMLYITISIPMRWARFVKNRRFDLLWANMRGTGLGILWVLRAGRQATV